LIRFFRLLLPSKVELLGLTQELACSHRYHVRYLIWFLHLRIYSFGHKLLRFSANTCEVVYFRTRKLIGCFSPFLLKL
jgi:hypothetical protein